MTIEHNPGPSLSREQIQEFMNAPELDVPAVRRDISRPENVRWLVRNLLIRNSKAVPQEYFEALKSLRNQ